MSKLYARDADGVAWILITASREWTSLEHRQRMRTAFTNVHNRVGGQIGIVHGAARGGDTMADEIATELGWIIDPVPCTPQEWNQFGKSAGHRRNARMVERRKYVGCVAFPLGRSPGTRGCMKLAEAADIPVWDRGDPWPVPTEVNQTMMSEIFEFKGKYWFLSNFYPIHITDQDGIEYPTLEHAFQAYKVIDLEQRTGIANLATPDEAKRAGRRIELRLDWELVKRNVMADLLTIKFPTSDSALSKKLLDTGDATLIEGNTWHDQEWGDCLCGGPRCRTQGRNWLGISLMQRREALRIAQAQT